MAHSDSEARELALENPLVLCEIFQYLTTKELLRLSLVNKLWNQECRRVIRDVKKYVAVIKGDNLCSRAREFNDMAGKLAVNPYNGLCLTVHQHKCKAAIRRSKMEDVYGNLLKMNLKYFELLWFDEGRSGTCPLEKFILRFLATSRSLQDVHLIHVPPRILLEQGAWGKDEARLQKLKAIRLGFELDLEEVEFSNQKSNFLELVARAPNLQEVRNRLCLDWIVSLPQEKLHIIKNMVLPRVYQEKEDITMRLLLDKFRKSEPKLHSLSLKRFVPVGNFTEQFYLTGLASIICSSSESLRTMEFDYGATLGLKTIAERLPLLSNVTKLNLNISMLGDPRIVQHFQRLPLAPLFANVTTVSVACTGDTEDARSFRAEGGGMFPWTTVTAVELKCEGLRHINVTELGFVFANARTLEISPACKSFHDFEFKKVWSSWPSLEQLSFSGKMQIPAFGNMDATFCGISWEEAAVLRRQDEEYLKAVHIVPTRPAINHHQGLKRLRIELKIRFTSTPVPSGILFLSKVTALVALRQMPDLDFQVRIDPEHAQHLEHLKPFVKVVPTTSE